MEILVLIIVIGLAVLFLKGFDRASGQSPKQVSDGIKQEGASEVPPVKPAAVATDAERIDQFTVLTPIAGRGPWSSNRRAGIGASFGKVPEAKLPQQTATTSLSASARNPAHKGSQLLCRRLP